MSLVVWIATLSALTYTALAMLGIYHARPSAPVQHLHRAATLYLAAFGAGIVNLGADILNPEAGGLSIGLDAFCLVAMLICVWVAEIRIARMESGR